MADEITVSRSWPGTGTPLEDQCPCPQEACGHIARSRVLADCPQHGLRACKTLRSMHDAEDCPGRRGCARDSDWCDGVICRERGIECPNADPAPTEATR